MVCFKAIIVIEEIFFFRIYMVLITKSVTDEKEKKTVINSFKSGEAALKDRLHLIRRNSIVNMKSNNVEKVLGVPRI